MSDAEIERLRAVERVAEQLADQIERRTAHDEWRAAGSRGMRVPFRGDLAGATPATMGELRRWLRDLRAAQRP